MPPPITATTSFIITCLPWTTTPLQQRTGSLAAVSHQRWRDGFWSHGPAHYRGSGPHAQGSRGHQQLSVLRRTHHSVSLSLSLSWSLSLVLSMLLLLLLNAHNDQQISLQFELERIQIQMPQKPLQPPPHVSPKWNMLFSFCFFSGTSQRLVWMWTTSELWARHWNTATLEPLPEASLQLVMVAIRNEVAIIRSTENARVCQYAPGIRSCLSKITQNRNWMS